jgi:hypothetical protein
VASLEEDMEEIESYGIPSFPETYNRKKQGEQINKCRLMLP